MSLRIVPVNRDQAFSFIADWHRHHTPPLGYRYAIGVAAGDLLVGVATVGRPVARHYDDGLTVEVTRVATDGTPHACSALYGACWRAAKAMGYVRAITYTHADESGASLRAAGWQHAATRAARSGWDMPGRRRSNDGYIPVDRLLWVVESTAAAGMPARVSRPAEVDPAPDLFTAAGVAA
ncbi:XF1762 family protein [Micromonospora haikouensis]|uniref:XF1762 family protein n=1 Tax=Micromonospora haikouensis TaxID=686309 RepID=UPI0036CA01C8